MVRVRAASSASNASAGAAMPRGVPVEPEVSLTTAVPGGRGGGERTGMSSSPATCPAICSVQSSGPAGQPGARRRAGAPRAARTRRASVPGVWASRRRAASPAWRRARSEARNPGPLAAASPTIAPGARCASASRRPAARARAAMSSTVALRSGVITSGASGARRTSRSKAWRIGSGKLKTAAVLLSVSGDRGRYGGGMILEAAPRRRSREGVQEAFRRMMDAAKDLVKQGFELPAPPGAR